MNNETRPLTPTPPKTATVNGRVYPISPRVDADGVPYVRPTRTGPRDRDGAPYVRVARPITTGFLFGVGLAMAWLVVLAATNLLAAVWQV